MTNAKNVYALMLALVIVLSGCFGATSDESDAQDSGSDDREQTDDSEDMDREEERQARTWYTSGGTFYQYWDDPNRNYNGYGCDSYSDRYDSSTGEYLGQECDSYSYADDFSDWDGTNCTDMGGVLVNKDQSEWDHNRPTCAFEFATINTTAGEVMLIYQMDGGLTVTTTCDGVSTNSAYDSSLSGREYWIVTGGAMDCSHTLYKEINHNYENNNNFVNDQNSSSNESSNSGQNSTAYVSPQDIWSIVYAIQDVTVVEQVSA